MKTSSYVLALLAAGNVIVQAAPTSAGIYSAVTNAAGSASASWQVTVTDAINVTNDLLLIYNTNSQDSTTVLNYYLAHRPGVSGANVLGIGWPGVYVRNFPGNINWLGAIHLTDYETISPDGFTNQVLNPILNWLALNPTKRPQYVVLMLDVPSRVNRVATNASYYPFYYGPSLPSLSYQLSTSVPGWQPYVTHLNMNGPDDCIAYINKLAAIGKNTLAGSPVISASAGGYGNTNYVIDDVNNIYRGIPVASNATNGLHAAGVPSASILYINGFETTGILPHLAHADNLAGYITWGYHSQMTGFYAVDGYVKWSGHSGWYLIETIESASGQRYQANMGDYVQWFSGSAFGGTDYSNTPVGAVAHTDEPGLGGVSDAAVYFGLWASGKNFAVCAWNSRRTPFFQAVGDPFVTK